MKTLNELIGDYTKLLQLGEMQLAYKGILDYIGKLRSDFTFRYPDYEIGGIYHGYMDMSYFSLITKQLKDRKLKIAIVYLHEKKTFEIWLSGRNSDVIKKYKNIFNVAALQEPSFFHDNDNKDSIIEYILISEPNFDNQAMLTEIIHEETEKFLSVILKNL